MSMFFDIFAALLAWGAAAAWVLTGGDKLPPDWDHLRTGGADKLFDSGDLSVSSNIFLTPEKPQFLGSRRLIFAQCVKLAAGDLVKRLAPDRLVDLSNPSARSLSSVARR